MIGASFSCSNKCLLLSLFSYTGCYILKLANSNITFMRRVLLPDHSLQVNDNFQNTTNVLIFEFKTLYSSTYYIKVIIQISNKRKKTLCLTGSNSFFFLQTQLYIVLFRRVLKKSYLTITSVQLLSISNLAPALANF